MNENDEPEIETEDVEGHQLSGGPGQLSGVGKTDESGDDVEAHQLSGGPGQLSGFGATDDDGDDVEAHKLY
ncbi:MAG: hypothetical protein ACXVRJ_02215 [Gaiellaceae bacterium]